MKIRLLPVLLSFLFVMPAIAAAADDPAQFRLDAAILQKLETVNAEAQRLGLDEDEGDDDDDDSDDESIDDIVRRMEGNPQLRALLARHGLTARQVALATHALLHASMFLAFEGAMDKQGAARLYSDYSAVQKANIEFMRTRKGAGR